MLIQVLNHYRDMSRAAADFVEAQIRAKPDCVLGLPTGETPIGLYGELCKDYAEGKVDFSKVSTYN